MAITSHASRSMKCIAVASLVATLAGPVLGRSLNLQIIPAAPRYQEPVYVRLVRQPLEFGVFYGATTSMTANRITVVYYEYPELSTSTHDVSLGQLPAGTYTVDVVDTGGAIAATTQFTVAVAATPTRGMNGVPSVNFTGHWWGAAEPGWGLSIMQGPTNLLFATWFVHDAAGQPVWYTMEPGAWTNAETVMTFEGPIYRTTATYFRVPVVSPPSGVQVGNGALVFRDSQSGDLNFVIDGIRTVKGITKLPIE